MLRHAGAVGLFATAQLMMRPVILPATLLLHSRARRVASFNRRVSMLAGAKRAESAMFRLSGVILSLVLVAWPVAAIAQPADLVIVNASVRTMDKAQPAASAVAVLRTRENSTEWMWPL